MKTDWTKLERNTHKDGSPLNLDPQVGADERGQIVVLPGPRDVFLDIDSDEAFEYMYDRLEDVRKLGGQLVLISAEPSKSGLPKRHVILRAPNDLSDEERIALQAVLGSDLIREFLSLMRKWGGGPATTFYENPDWKDPRLTYDREQCGKMGHRDGLQRDGCPFGGDPESLADWQRGWDRALQDRQVVRTHDAAGKGSRDVGGG